jgi:uncharacterized protein YdhG (YjbR/CyaY superfamily)
VHRTLRVGRAALAHPIRLLGLNLGIGDCVVTTGCKLTIAVSEFGQGGLRAPAKERARLSSMPTPKPTNVDAYLAAQPPEVRAALVKVRAAMRRALPTSVEAIKYNMPAYLVEGRAVASFAGWKDHYALYFVSSTLFDAIRKDLEGRDASKGIIRFNLNEPVPDSVVARLAEWNSTAVAGRTAAGGAKKPAERKTASPRQKRNTRGGP